MKKWIFYILFIFVGSNCFAQTPEFEFQLYFEDAAGNKDTVTLGYDALATDTIDAAFGEVNILNQPWGNGLDVRVGNKIYHGENPQGLGGQWCIQPIDTSLFDCSSSENMFLTKKQFIKTSCVNTTTIRRLSIQFYTNTYPLVIKWDKSKFQNICRQNSIFIGRSDHYNWDAGGAIYLQNMDSLILQDTVVSNGIEGTLDLPTYQSGGKCIGVLQLEMSRYSSVGLEVNSFNNIVPYPNPVSIAGILNIGYDSKYKLLNGLGQIIQQGATEEQMILMENIPMGLYSLILIPNNQNIYRYKICVQ